MVLQLRNVIANDQKAEGNEINIYTDSNKLSTHIEENTGEQQSKEDTPPITQPHQQPNEDTLEADSTDQEDNPYTPVKGRNSYRRGRRRSASYTDRGKGGY